MGSLVALLLVGLAGGGLWCAEVLYHGWAGLAWLGYFHWAVPAGILLFIAWAVWAHRDAAPSRLLLAVALIAFAVPAACATGQAMAYYFAAGPRAMMLAIQPRGSWLRYSIIGVWLSIPFSLALWLRVVGKPVPIACVAASFILFSASPFLALAMLRALTPFDDLIHVVKTGIGIPFFVVSLGILLLPHESRP
jgi:hypothetical protein